MSSPNPSEYLYTSVKPTWDHHLVLPSILQMLRNLPPEGSILDVGCGNGTMLEEIHKRGSWKLAGVDSSRSAISIARARGFDVHLADATKGLLELFPPHSFDLVLAIEVIEHVYSPRDLLRQVRGVLKPGGRILLTTPYHGYVKNLLIAALGRCDSHYNPLWDCGHIKFWSRRTLTQILKDTGYHDIQFEAAGRVPYLWKSIVATASVP